MAAGDHDLISAAEGQKFAQVMGQLEELRKTVTADEIADAREVLKPKPKKKPLPVAKAAPAPAG